MINIAITSNPDAAFALLPFYVEDDMTKEQVAEELYARLCNKPDDTLILGLTDEKGLCGMAVAYARKDDVFLWQAHALPEVPKHWVDLALGLIIGWAKKKGFHRLTAGTNKDSKIWKRRWEFEILNDREVFKEI